MSDSEDTYYGDAAESSDQGFDAGYEGGFDHSYMRGLEVIAAKD